MDRNKTKGLSEALLSKSNIDESVCLLGPRMSMCLLLVTVVLESIGTLLLKRSLEDYRCMIMAYVCYFSSLGLFSVVLRQISLSVAYTTWCTLGTVSVCLLSKVFYNENISTSKAFCIVLTIPCVIGMYVLP